MDDIELQELFDNLNKEFSPSNIKEWINNYFEKIILDSENPDVFSDWGSMLLYLAKRKEDETIFKDVFEKYEKATQLNSDYAIGFFNWGCALLDFAKLKRDEALFMESYKKFEKATELNPCHAGSFSNWGYALSDLAAIKEDESLFRDSFEKFGKAVQLKPEDYTTYINWGCALYDLARLKRSESLFRESIEKFEIAIRLNQSSTEAFLNYGNALFALANIKEDESLYKESLKQCEKALLLSPNNANVFHAWGNTLLCLARIKKDASLYKASIEKLEKAILLKPDYADAFCCLGISFFELTTIEKNEPLLIKALEKFETASKLDPEDAYTFSYWGLVLFLFASAKKDETIFRESFEKFEKSAKEDSTQFEVFINWGNALLELAKLKKDESLINESIEKYKKAAELRPDEVKVFGFWGRAICILAIIKEDDSLFAEAVQLYKKSKNDILNIFLILDEEYIEYILNKKIIHSLLDLDTDDGRFFIENTKDADKNKLDTYKEAYILSVFIISKLHINNNYEKSVAYYTNKTVSHKLLFEGSKFRLNSINYSNDPTEGKILLDYLFEGEKSYPKDTEYGAFASCFTFNYDSLNQFRLYGKEKNKEGTGLSLVFWENFFSKEAEMAMKQPKPDYKGIDRREVKHALFRCIYIDPITRRIESVGQKDKYIFYREGNEREIESYTKYIDGIHKIIEEKMNRLNKLVEDLNQIVIGQLLINLRYLIKHIAFKDEQECRIVKIFNLKDSNIKFEINNESSQMLYVEYDPIVSSYIKKVIFGPKATGMELFQDILTHKGLNIPWKESKNPLA